MLPSNTDGNNCSISSINPYTDHTIFQRPFFTHDDINTFNYSKQEDPLQYPFSLFHFPSPLHIHYEEEDHHGVFVQQLPMSLMTTTTDANNNIVAAAAAVETTNMFDNSNKSFNINHQKLMGGNCKKNHMQTTPRKRSSKRDRHSKINTAQGPRDRRMRLSLDIARQFFDLQDRLGYDKASKTVEWLLSKAKPDIKKLSRGVHQQMQMKGSCSVGWTTTKSATSTSDQSCEVVSGLIDEGVAINGNNNQQGTMATAAVAISKVIKPSKEIIKRSRQSRKAAFHTLARESREKARERARERTKEKMWSRRRSCTNYSTIHNESNQELNQVGSWSPCFGNGDQESGSQSHHNNMNKNPVVLLEAVADHEVEEAAGGGGGGGDMVDESLVSMGKWSPSHPILHYCLHNSGIFQEVSSNNKKFSDMPNIDSARMYYSTYCATTTSLHPSTGTNDQDGIIPCNSNFLTAPYDCLQHQFADFDQF